MKSFRTIFHDASWKLVRLVGFLTLGGLVLIVADIFLVPQLPGSAVVSSIVQKLSTSIIGAAILVLIVDIGFRQEMLNDIQNIFRASQRHVFIDRTVSGRHELLNSIVSDVQKAVRGDQIDTIGVVAGTFFTGSPGHDLLKQKIVDGCHFRVIILHPNSLLLTCIQNESRFYGTPDVRSSVMMTAEGVINQLIEELRIGRSNIRGSIEIRMHKDILSCAYYYSSSALTIFSPYLAHKRGELCPAFTTADRQYREELKGHFSAMWKQSEEYTLAKVNRNEFANNILELLHKR